MLLSYLPAAAARSHLKEGRALLQDAKSALLHGDLSGASKDFNGANERFIQASSDMRNPLLKAAGGVPLLGRTPDAVKALADAGQLVAQAGTELTQAVQSLPNGLDSLAPTNGRLPVETMTKLAGPVAQAQLLVRGALRSVEETSSSFLFGPVGDARQQGVTQLTDLDRSLSSAAALLKGAPAFLGTDHPVRYFFGAQNPAELRGTGGLMGAYSILTIDDGKLSFAPFQAVENLQNKIGRIQGPSAEYDKNYRAFGGAGFWLNLNMTPDFPTAATAIEDLYKADTGETVDGVLVADPFALEQLLGVTGSVDVPGYGITVSKDDVVSYTTNGAYSKFSNSPHRKTVLGDVARAVFDQFMSASTPAADAARALIGTVSGGHLQIFTGDADFQKGLQIAGAAGSLSSGGGDLLAIVQNNGGGNKVDYYEDRTVNYTVHLGADGTASADANVEIANNAPTSGQPQYVIGPYKGVSKAGENVAFVSTYCPASCELSDLQRNGREISQRSGMELGQHWYQAYVKTPSGHTTTLDYSLSNDHAWQGDDSSGAYTLTLLNQPTIRPTKVTIRVLAPDGMNITSTSVPMQVDGNSAVWTGTPGARMTLEIHFSRGLPGRIWNGVKSFFSKPLF